MQPSAPFRDREFNGTTLLEEWAELRAAGETPLAVASAVLALRQAKAASRTPTADPKLRFSQWIASARGGTPGLAAVVARWIPRVRSETDAEALLAHLERLALAGELVDAGGRRA
jgi:hypothetical protein